MTTPNPHPLAIHLSPSPHQPPPKKSITVGKGRSSRRARTSRSSSSRSSHRARARAGVTFVRAQRGTGKAAATDARPKVSPGAHPVASTEEKSPPQSPVSGQRVVTSSMDWSRFSQRNLLRQCRLEAVKPVPHLPWKHVVVLNVVFAGLYWLVAKLSIDYFSFPGSPASPVWPAAGLAVVLCWHFGWRRMWPSILVGETIVNMIDLHDSGVSTQNAFFAALLTGVGNALEASVIASLNRRASWLPSARVAPVDQLAAGVTSSDVVHPFVDPWHMLRFVASCFIGNLLSAFCGAFSLVAVLIPWDGFRITLFTWFAGNFAGVMTIVPLFIGHQVWVCFGDRNEDGELTFIAGLPAALRYAKRGRTLQDAALEGAVLFSVLVAMCALVFSGSDPLDARRMSQLSAIFYLLSYAALVRFYWIGSSVAVLAIAIATVLGTTHSNGPFIVFDDSGDPDQNDSLINASLYVWTVALVVQFVQSSLCSQVVLEIGLEQRVAARTRALVSSNDKLNTERLRAIEARDAAQQATKSKMQFLNSVSHEMRTPLHGLRGNVEILLETTLAPHQLELMHTITLCSDHLLTVINDVLDLSKLMSGKFSLHRRQFDLSGCIDNAVKLAYNPMQHRHLEAIQLYSKCDSLLVHGDETRVRQILVNLLSNALKFSVHSGHVVVRVRQVQGNPIPPRHAYVAPIESDQPLSRLEEERLAKEAHLSGEAESVASLQPRRSILVSVADSGIGIPADKMERLFKPFSQVNSSSTRTFQGTGLGLAICAKLVHRMGGAIWLTSVPGEGSTFTFTLPIQTHVAEQNALHLRDSTSSSRIGSRTSDTVSLSASRKKSMPLILVASEDDKLRGSAASLLELMHCEVETRSFDDRPSVARGFGIIFVLVGSFASANTAAQDLLSKLAQRGDADAAADDDAKPHPYVVVCLPAGGTAQNPESTEAAAAPTVDASVLRRSQSRNGSPVSDAERLASVNFLDFLSDFRTANRQLWSSRFRVIERPLLFSVVSATLQWYASDVHLTTAESPSYTGDIMDSGSDRTSGQLPAPPKSRSSDLIMSPGSPFTLTPTGGLHQASSTAVVPGAEMLRCLVVEDNSVNQRLAGRHLRRLGVRAEFADNGSLAVEMVKDEALPHFNLILMDIQMPGGVDGLEATRLIRKYVEQHQLEQPRVVAMTANVMQEEIDEYLTLMDDVLSKPFKIDDVRAVLERATHDLQQRLGELPRID